MQQPSVWRRIVWQHAALVAVCLSVTSARAELPDFREVGPQWPRDDQGAIFDWPAEPADEGEDEITTDRPDFTEASSTVGAGTLQFETGYTYGFDDDGPGSTHTHSYPETLMRYGVFADWFELRAAFNYGHEITGPIRNAGAEDLYLGAKLGLTLQQGVFPEMALVPQMTIPTGSEAFSNDRVLPGANWLYGWDINEFLGTGGSTQFNRALDDTSGNEYTEWAQSWTVNFSLLENVGMYTEWFAFFPRAADTARTQHYFDGGFTVKFTPDVQWDIRAGKGLNDAADDYFIGTGLSWRMR
jgi:hypothetical protein